MPNLTPLIYDNHSTIIDIEPEDHDVVKQTWGYNRRFILSKFVVI